MSAKRRAKWWRTERCSTFSAQAGGEAGTPGRRGSPASSVVTVRRPSWLWKGVGEATHAFGAGQGLRQGSSSRRHAGVRQLPRQQHAPGCATARFVSSWTIWPEGAVVNRSRPSPAGAPGGWGAARGRGERRQGVHSAPVPEACDTSPPSSVPACGKCGSQLLAHSCCGVWPMRPAQQPRHAPGHAQRPPGQHAARRYRQRIGGKPGTGATADP